MVSELYCSSEVSLGVYFGGATSTSNAPNSHRRFLANYGVYSSVKYLSLSDVTVLTFITPIFTGLAGAVFLGEHLSIRVALAGCKHFHTLLATIIIHQMIVCSFLGIILISRPEFLFGGLPDLTQVTPTQRMLSVMSEKISSISQKSVSHCCILSLALIGVLGLTGNCEFAFCEESTDYFSLTHHEVLSLRAIGERAHILHPVTSFSLLSVLFSTFGYVLSTPHKANP